MADVTETSRDPAWLMRTYSGHSTARASNELYRSNLAKGQTGLSVAFDLPTQTGYDPDSLLAKGEVGKVGVPVAHLGHMRQRLLIVLNDNEMSISPSVGGLSTRLNKLRLTRAYQETKSATIRTPTPRATAL